MGLFMNKSYITVTADGIITNGFSSAYREKNADDILILEHQGSQFRLFEDGIENPPLYSIEWNIPLYKWNGTTIIERTAEEKQADIDAQPPMPMTEQEAMMDLIVDVDYRLSLQELGLTEEGELL